MNSPHIIGFDPNAQKYLHQIHRFRCHFSPRINWTRSVQDAKKSTGEKIERQGLTGLRFIGKTASEWAMYGFFVDHESDGFRSDEHDNCHDLTWKRMSSISGNMWSMYQYVCSIHLNRLRIVCQRITHDPSRSCIIPSHQILIILQMKQDKQHMKTIEDI